MMDHEDFMRLTIDKAFEGIEAGQTPFGACVVRDGQVLAVEHNRVWSNTDITAHAEICAIRSACSKINSIDLSGCVIYSTTEPCPMCFSAIHWARIEKIFYGTSISDAETAGFNELAISNDDMKKAGKTNIEIVGQLCKDDAMKLFEQWEKHKKGKTY